MRSWTIVTGILVALVGASVSASAAEPGLDLEVYGNADPLLRPRTPLACQMRGETTLAVCMPVTGRKLQGEALRAQHIARALVLLRLFKMPEAQVEMDRALAVRPRTLATLHLAARTLIADFTVEPKTLAQAESYVDEALRKNPFDSNLMSTKAYIFHQRGQMDQSLRLLDRAIAIDVRNVFARRQRAMELTARNRPSEAAAEYGHLIGLQPDEGEWPAARGQLLLRLGDAAGAIADFDRAQALSVFSPLVYASRATAQALLGAFPAAIADLSVLIDGSPEGVRFAIAETELAQFLTARGLLHLRLNNRDQAVADILRAVALGGKPSALRLQVFLAGRGIAVPIDGERSEALRTAITTCFGEGECAEKLGLNL